MKIFLSRISVMSWNFSRNLISQLPEKSDIVFTNNFDPRNKRFFITFLGWV